MKKILTLLIASVFLLSTGFTARAQTRYVYAPKSKVNVRATPSTSGAKAGTLQKYIPVPLIEETDGWYKIGDKVGQGYVSSMVSTTCDAAIPSDFFGKSLAAQEEPANLSFYEATITITPKADGKVVITCEWNSMDMGAVCIAYIGTIKDGIISLTHQKYGSFEGTERISELLADAEPIETPLYIGYDPQTRMIIFSGAPFN